MMKGLSCRVGWKKPESLYGRSSEYASWNEHHPRMLLLLYSLTLNPHEAGHLGYIPQRDVKSKAVGLHSRSATTTRAQIITCAIPYSHSLGAFLDQRAMPNKEPKQNATQGKRDELTNAA